MHWGQHTFTLIIVAQGVWVDYLLRWFRWSGFRFGGLGCSALPSSILCHAPLSCQGPSTPLLCCSPPCCFGSLLFKEGSCYKHPPPKNKKIKNSAQINLSTAIFHHFTSLYGWLFIGLLLCWHKYVASISVVLRALALQIASLNLEAQNKAFVSLRFILLNVEQTKYQLTSTVLSLYDCQIYMLRVVTYLLCNSSRNIWKAIAHTLFKNNWTHHSENINRALEQCRGWQAIHLLCARPEGWEGGGGEDDSCRLQQGAPCQHERRGRCQAGAQRRRPQSCSRGPPGRPHQGCTHS